MGLCFEIGLREMVLILDLSSVFLLPLFGAIGSVL
jgi:hypothetical protein